MDQPAPPKLSQKTSKQGYAFQTFIALLLVLVVIPFLITSFIGLLFFLIVIKSGEITIKPSPGPFQVNVVEIKSQPNYFEERVRIRCKGDMTASLMVTDLRQVGLLETNGLNGQLYYRDGVPHLAGESAIVKADGQFSTCEAFFRVTTSATNTMWYNEYHTKGGSSSSGTTIPGILHVTNIETNWQGFFDAGSEIPLANLGDYKILLSAK